LPTAPTALSKRRNVKAGENVAHPLMRLSRITRLSSVSKTMEIVRNCAASGPGCRSHAQARVETSFAPSTRHFLDAHLAAIPRILAAARPTGSAPGLAGRAGRTHHRLGHDVEDVDVGVLAAYVPKQFH
jgi:hypothetical protein